MPASEPKSPTPAGAPRKRGSSTSRQLYKAVYVPVDGPAKDVGLPVISKFGAAEHTQAIQKLFTKDKTEQNGGNGFPPRTEAGVAAGWAAHGFPRLTVITDSAANAGMPRNTVASKILTGPGLAAEHKVLAVNGPAVILAESADESSETALEQDFTTEDLKKLLEAYEESSLSKDTEMDAEPAAEE